MSNWKYREGSQESKSLDAVTAGTGKAISFQDYDSVHWLIEGSAGVGAGAVVIESASSPTYAGTWKLIAGPTTVVASAQIGDKSDFPPGHFVRARVSTTVTGGTVTVYLNGRRQE
ncbi:MAG TPA: hypothetical protein VJZ77_05755 [Blastocatellia bacterium]|nr:hypothetical protein [Blastocatellia bacterium]